MTLQSRLVALTQRIAQELKDTGWITITPNSGFTQTMAAYRIKHGIVYWRGAIYRTAGDFTTASEIICTIPVEARPSDQVRAQTAGEPTGINRGIITILNTDGRMTAAQAGVSSHNAVRLSAISPYVSGAV